jgi:outer membrane protein OmpA-like peptidoglycan-associated protein
MRSVIRAVPWLLLLAACSSPPKPPTVDESQRRPVNSQMAVELQVCKNDLHNTRLLATESGRLAESTATTLANLAARQQILAAMQVSAGPPPAGQQVRANSVFTVRFEFGRTQAVIPPDTAAALIADAKAAPLILLRGRTDGATDSPAEGRIARDRAAAVRDFLVAAGVDPARIRATWQPVGDPVADNGSATGRGLNRRVEIELYRALPVVLGSTLMAHPNSARP